MERLIKMILVVQPETIDRLRELMEEEYVGLEELKARLDEKLSEIRTQVKSYIHYLYFLLTFSN